MNTSVDLILDGVIYKQTPSKHLMGREIEKWTKLKTTKDFISDAIKLWGDKYDYSRVEYSGCFDPVKIIFKGKIYNQKPSQHLQGMKCERDIIRNQDDFLKKAKDKHGNKYDYSITKYNGINSKIEFIYNGEVYKQKAGSHLYSGLVEKRKKKKTTKEFISESEIIHDFKYDYSKSLYINYQTKVIIICPIHGEWKQSAGSHLQGYGCPICVKSSGEKKISKILNKLNLNFIREYRFKNCGINHSLPFDFYIPSARIAIEFYGKHHYQPMEIFGGIAAYEVLKINDKIKLNYCEDNFINLIIIRYDDEYIEKILYENLKNFIKKGKHYTIY